MGEEDRAEVAVENDMNDLSKLAAEVLARETNDPAIEFEGRSYDWTEVRHLADQLAALMDESGAHPRGPVLFIARNQPAALAAFLGLLRSGRNIRMAYPFQSAAGLARDVARLKPSIVVAAEREYSPEVKTAIAAERAAAIVISEMRASSVPGLEHSNAALDPDLPDEPHVAILTSGTTGPPKHFAVSYDMLFNHFTGATMRALGTSGSATPAPAPPPTLLYYPLGNISGLFSTLPTLLRGGRMMVLERFNLKDWRDYVVRFRPPISGTPAATIGMILDADLPAEDLASLKYFATGAAPVDPTVQRNFEERYGIPVLLSYGATEFGGPVSAMTPELHALSGGKKIGSVGKPFGGARIRIVDPESGAELPPGEEGLLEVITPRIGPDWIHTSDIGLFDSDGYLFIRGRADGAIMRGGFKLLPETIERALLLHDSISAAAVIGVPDRRLGQVPAAAIQFKPSGVRPSASELEAHLREHVLATHIPVHWRFVDDLPKTVSLKVDRRGVERLFQK